MRRTLNDTDGSVPLSEEPGGAQGEGLSEFKGGLKEERKSGSWVSWLPSFVFFVIVAASCLSALKGMGRQEL